MTKRIFYLMLINIFCNTNNELPTTEEIISLLNSKDDKDKLILGVYYAGESRDSFFIKPILEVANDPRVSHNKHFYGMSVHQSCMIALKKITNTSPPNIISHKVDYDNIKFYINIK